MKKIISDRANRIIRNREELEQRLDVKITNKRNEIFVEGTSENEYSAQKVIDALNFGFPFTTALRVLEEEVMFEIINIKDHTKREKLGIIRGRLIGTNGRALSTLTELTKCSIELNGNRIGIIGHAENIKNVESAIVSLIQGAKHANVYAFLEKNRPEQIIDLGIKENLGRQRTKEQEVENKKIRKEEKENKDSNENKKHKS